MSLQFRVLGNRISITGTGSRMGKIFLFVAILLISLFRVGLCLAVVYVDHGRPGGDGSSWVFAYKTIEDAIGGRGESEEFWVAGGGYAPLNSLTPKPGSQFYGGFTGNETVRDQRDVSTNPTIIDGKNAIVHVIYINSLATNVRIDGFTIKRGNATSSTGFDNYGGAIFVNLQAFIVANCTFEENAAESQGGAVFINRAPATFQNCKFQSNSSAHGGGLAGFQSAFTISGCEFHLNTADGNGGGIYNDEASTTISDCKFSQNSALTQGGAISVNRGPATVQNCEFQSNSSERGGAVAGHDSDVTISGCQFESNNANIGEQPRGGALYLYLQSPEIVNCTFTGNSAGLQGGAFELNSTPGARVSDCTFTNNSAEQYGGAIYNNAGSGIIEKCTFTGSTSAVVGGAICLEDALETTVKNCEFESNSSALGGAVGGYDSNVIVSNCQFESNRADIGEQPRGGAIYLDLQSPEILNCTFRNNTAGWTGGAVELNGTQNAFVSGCNFFGNRTDRAGGGLAGSTSDDGSATVKQCLFQNNSCVTGGGGIYSYQFHFLIQESTFQGNTAGDGGGIMMDYKLDKASQVERCLFLGNSASTTGGGGLYSYARSVGVDNSVFAYNLAPNGGAMWMNAGVDEHFDPNFSVTIRNCTLYGNRAYEENGQYGYGGAMVNSDVSMAYLYNCIFWGNQAEAQIWDGSAYITTPDVFNGGNTSSMTTRYTDMETLDWDHWSKTETHTGSFSSDPMFEDPDGADNIEGTLDDDFHLTLSSPCLDHADGDNAPELDIDFDVRRDLVGVPNLGIGTPPYGDLGPYETQPVSFVNKDDSTCGGKVPCYTSIQGAIEAATDGTTVKIVQGDYAEAIILSTSKDLSLKAGWDSTFTTQSSNSGIQSLTIIDGTMKTEYLVIR